VARGSNPREDREGKYKMSEDFYRWYIGYISLTTLHTVQRESGRFNEWDLLVGSDFNLKESYGHRDRGDIPKQDELMLEAIAQRSIIAETRQPESVKPSVFWGNALNMADVLTLLSLARARYYSAFARERKRGASYGINWGVIHRDIAGTWDIVTISNLGQFISEALAFVETNPDWLEESGFIPSIYWFAQAQISYHTAPSILEMGLYWVALETLAGTYIDARGLGITNKKDRVKKFISDKGYSDDVWSFLDKVIDDWYEVRNDLFHEGKQDLPVELLIKRRQQVRDFTSLVLVEMLQNQGEGRRKEIAKRIQSY
jgi:hypothetical protein